jgi:nucleotide-binding universal stress UspA family protein
MFRRIVIPLDGTRRAEAALPYAAALARQFDARIVLVRAVVGAARRAGQLVSLAGYGATPMALDLAVIAAEAEQLDAQTYLMQQASALRAQDFSVLASVVDASPALALRAVACREPDTIVVMAGRDGDWLARLLGRAPRPERLRRAGVAVLVVPTDGCDGAPDRATLHWPRFGRLLHSHPSQGRAW